MIRALFFGLFLAFVPFVMGYLNTPSESPNARKERKAKTRAWQDEQAAKRATQAQRDAELAQRLKRQERDAWRAYHDAPSPETLERWRLAKLWRFG